MTKSSVRRKHIRQGKTGESDGNRSGAEPNRKETYDDQLEEVQAHNTPLWSNYLIFFSGRFAPAIRTLSCYQYAGAGESRSISRSPTVVGGPVLLEQSHCALANFGGILAYLVILIMDPISEKKEPPQHSGRFSLASTAPCRICGGPKRGVRVDKCPLI